MLSKHPPADECILRLAGFLYDPLTIVCQGVEFLCEAADSGMTMTDVKLLGKQGGKSGHCVA